MAMSWMIKFARKRNEKSMAEKLAYEILAAYKEEGASIKKKTEAAKKKHKTQGGLENPKGAQGAQEGHR